MVVKAPDPVGYVGLCLVCGGDETGHLEEAVDHPPVAPRGGVTASPGRPTSSARLGGWVGTAAKGPGRNNQVQGQGNAGLLNRGHPPGGAQPGSVRGYGAR